MHTSIVDTAVHPLRENPSVVCTNLAAPIRSLEEMNDLNTTKIVTAGNGSALYFSRQPIPSGSSEGLKQVCDIPFRRDFLLHYARLEPTPLEIAECADMLRISDTGVPARIVPSI